MLGPPARREQRFRQLGAHAHRVPRHLRQRLLALSLPQSIAFALPDALSQRFELGKVAGHGAMGRIYKGQDRVTGKPVLVKVNPRERFRPEVFAQWRHVNEVLAQLGHPVFLPAIDMGYVGDSCWQIVPVVAAARACQHRLPLCRPMPGHEAATARGGTI